MGLVKMGLDKMVHFEKIAKMYLELLELLLELLLQLLLELLLELLLLLLCAFIT